METTSISRLKARLSHYLRIAHAGEEVIITKDSRPVARLVSVPGPRPKFGSARGLVKISDDFDGPLDDFKEHVE